MQKRSWHALALGGALVVSGCPSEPTSPPPPPPPPVTPPDAGPVAVELPEINGPVARVNGVDIAKEPFLREYKTTVERYQQARHAMSASLRELLKANIVQRLVENELLRQQARLTEVRLDTAHVEKQWEEHKKRYGSPEAFKAFLERAKTTEAEIREHFELTLLREEVFKTLTAKIDVTDAEIKQYYEQNKSRFSEPEQIRASHILLRVPRDAPDSIKAEKRKLAEELAKRTKKEDFAELARQFGEDPTKARGGDLGFFARGRMVRPFEEAVFKLKDGQVSGVVETDFGFHIIKRTGYKAAHEKSLKELKEQLDRSIRTRKRNEAIRDQLRAWKDSAKVEILIPIERPPAAGVEAPTVEERERPAAPEGVKLDPLVPAPSP